MITEVTVEGKAAERLKFKGPFLFKPGLNVLVGGNGSGKSTLLRLIRDAFHKDKTQRDEGTTVKKTKLLPPLYWASEDSGVRNISHFRDDIDMMPQIASIFSSRGQAQNGYLTFWLKEITPMVREGALVLLDEPDVTLDTTTVAVLAKILQAPKSQFIVAAHHPLLVLQDANIIEMEPGYVSEVKGLFRGIFERWVREEVGDAK